MRYVEFRDSIQQKLQAETAGLTWRELRDVLSLPYDRPCPNWTRRLEEEIGLVREKSSGRALLWSLKPKP